MFGPEQQRAVIVQRLSFTREPVRADMDGDAAADRRALPLPFIGHCFEIAGADAAIITIDLLQNRSGEIHPGNVADAQALVDIATQLVALQ